MKFRLLLLAGSFLLCFTSKLLVYQLYIVETNRSTVGINTNNYSHGIEEKKARSLEYKNEHLEKIVQPNEPDIENYLEETSIEEEDDIKLIIAKEVTSEIKSNINPKTVIIYDIFTGEIN